MILEIVAILYNDQGFNKGLWKNIWSRKSANHLKFIEESIMGTGEHDLVKIFYNCGKIGLLQQSWIEKTMHCQEAQWLYSKEKVSGTVVNKQYHAHYNQGHERIPTNNFLWKEEMLIVFSIEKSSGKIHLTNWMTRIDPSCFSLFCCFLLDIKS